MCETRDLGIKWPYWQTLLSEAVEMGVVCTQDAKKRLLKHARMVFWKTRAAEHEWVELKEGVWLEPTQATLRRKSDELWIAKPRNVMRKLVVEGGWVEKRLYDTGWSDEK